MPHALCFWQLNLKLKQKHHRFPAWTQKNTKWGSQVRPDMKPQPSPFYAKLCSPSQACQNVSLKFAWPSSLCFCQSDCISVHVCTRSTGVFLSLQQRQDCPPFVFFPTPQKPIHLQAHGWNWHANMQQNGLTNGCVRTRTHTVTGIQGKITSPRLAIKRQDCFLICTFHAR